MSNISETNNGNQCRQEINILSIMDKILEKTNSIKRKEKRTGLRRRLDPFSPDIAEIEEELKSLENFLDLSRIQVCTLIVCMEWRNCICMEELAISLGMSKLKLLSLQHEFEQMQEKGYIKIRKSDNSVEIPQKVIKTLMENKKVLPEKLEGLSSEEILIKINEALENLGEKEIERTDFMNRIEIIINKNPAASVSKFYKDFIYQHVYMQEIIVFFRFVCLYYFNDDDEVTVLDMEDYLDDAHFIYIKRSFKRGESFLQKMKIIENTGEGDFLNREYFHLTDKAKEKIFADIEGGYKPKESGKVVFASRKIESAAIVKKQMYYNPQEKKEIETLLHLLEPQRYNKVIERLRTKGLRSGFACLLYGTPGTGKTETVYQIAKECGRDIYMVNAAQIKSMWVGESEKNITKVFEKYKEAVHKNKDNAPILLFNEADAVFGARMQAAERAVDKSENTIQNIILQSMEDLEGILIATTNFTKSLDPAFERRFIYKIHFHKPNTEAKIKIWQSMMPELSHEQAYYLAEQYDFSGGQIENVSRKKEIDFILNESEPGFEQICEYCTKESFGKKEDSSIGF